MASKKIPLRDSASAKTRDMGDGGSVKELVLPCDVMGVGMFTVFAPKTSGDASKMLWVVSLEERTRIGVGVLVGVGVIGEIIAPITPELVMSTLSEEELI